jgi:general secretion pathway protein K
MRTLPRLARRAQQGVAIITALVVIAAATAAVSAMLWHQSLEARKLENREAQAEARWLALSAVDWARVILMVDARTSTIDHYGEPWAVPLAETRVTDPESSQNDAAAPAAFISGRILDAQARFNLAGLTASGKVNKQEEIAFYRLTQTLGLADDVAGAIVARMQLMPQPDDYAALQREFSALNLAPAAALDTLKPFVVILPTATPVNLNTASAEVLAACFDGVTLDQARALVKSRDQAVFNQASDATTRLAGLGVDTAATNSVAVSTSFFVVTGRVRFQRAEVDTTSLIERDATGLTKVVRAWS